MPQAIPAVAAVWAAGATTTAIAGTALAGTLLGSLVVGGAAVLASSLAAKAIGLDKLGSSADFTSESRERTQVIKSAVATHKIIYGETISSGPLVFVASTGAENKYLHMVIPLAGHEVEDITEVYVGEERIILSTLDVNSEVTSGKYLIKYETHNEQHVPDGAGKVTLNAVTASEIIEVKIAKVTINDSGEGARRSVSTITTSDYTVNGNVITLGGRLIGLVENVIVRYNYSVPLVRIKKHLGISTQAADSDLVSEVSEWTTAHKLSDIAYIYVRLAFDIDTFMTGIPNIKAVVKGRKVYDPRSATTAYSDNWALCVRDYITADFGLNADSTEINDTAFIAAANASDELVVSQLAPPKWAVQTFVDATRPALLSKNGGVEGAYDSGTVSDISQTITTTVDPVSGVNGEFIVSISVDRGQEETSREFAIGISTSATSINPADFEYSWRATAYNPSTKVYTVEVFESNTSKFSTTVDSSSNNTNLKIRVVSGTTVTYLKDDTVVYTSLVSPTFPMYFSTAFKHTVKNVVIVSGGSKASRTRFTCNGGADTANTPKSILEQLVTAGAGAVTYIQGEYKISAGVYSSPVTTLTVDNLRGELNVRPRLPRKDLFNAVRGTYQSVANVYQAADFPAVSNATYATQDGETIYRDIELPFTSDSYAAQRIAKIHLEKSRQGITVDFPANLSVLELAPFDNIQLTVDQLGWTNKEFVINSWSMSPDGGVDLVLQEEASAAYDWDHGKATVVDPAPDTNLPNPFVVDDVDTTTITFTKDKYRVNGSGVLAWTAPSDIFTFEYRVRVTTIADSNTVARSVYETTTRDTNVFLPDLNADTYLAYITATNTLGVSSSAVGFVIEVDRAELPPRVTGLELDLGGEKGEANGTEWTGRDVKIKWRPSGLTEYFELGSEDYGAGSGFTDWTFKDYEVQVLDGSGSLLRTEFITDTSYTYTFEKNAEDYKKLNGTSGANRTVSFKVFTRGRQNQKSKEPAIL